MKSLLFLFTTLRVPCVFPLVFLIEQLVTQLVNSSSFVMVKDKAEQSLGTTLAINILCISYGQEKHISTSGATYGDSTSCLLKAC